jgi:hypothetical protein
MSVRNWGGGGGCRQHGRRDSSEREAQHAGEGPAWDRECGGRGAVGRVAARAFGAQHGGGAEGVLGRGCLQHCHALGARVQQGDGACIAGEGQQEGSVGDWMQH